MWHGLYLNLYSRLAPSHTTCPHCRLADTAYTILVNLKQNRAVLTTAALTSALEAVATALMIICVAAHYSMGYVCM